MFDVRIEENSHKMNIEIERNLGEQPIARIMADHGLKAHDLVAISTQQLTHKMVNGDKFSLEEWERFRTHWEPAAFVPASPEQLGDGIGGFWQFPIRVEGLKEGVASAKV